MEGGSYVRPNDLGTGESDDMVRATPKRALCAVERAAALDGGENHGPEQLKFITYSAFFRTQRALTKFRGRSGRALMAAATAESTFRGAASRQSRGSRPEAGGAL